MEPTTEKEFVAEPNFLEALMDSLNIVAAPNGSVMKGGGLQSPNFSKGLSGWRIESNGDVEFNNGTFRGSLSGATGSFTGTITASGISISSVLTNTGTSTLDYLVLTNVIKLKSYTVANLPT